MFEILPRICTTEELSGTIDLDSSIKVRCNELMKGVRGRAESTEVGAR